MASRRSPARTRHDATVGALAEVQIGADRMLVDRRPVDPTPRAVAVESLAAAALRTIAGKADAQGGAVLRGAIEAGDRGARFVPFHL